ncbi:histidine phosphatase family protein [Paenibacillus sp.]|uniref:histidine phosphatase family protein n=1 Tax=Paenibacillus sp. TaxID=58172 RepID=UPI002810FE13|nr:histidine phosphatase family protein [Paenibacillus sp.]
MVSNFILVRHALKVKAIGDVSITPDGVMQAQLTAKHLSGMPVTAIVSSPLRRAKETAEYIASATKSVVIEDTRLRERANWGDLPGQTFNEFVEMWERCTRDPDHIPPIGDSARKACERMSSLLFEFGRKHPPESNIVIVSHGGCITDFLVNTIPETDLNVWHPRFIEVQSNLIPECSITKLRYENGHYKIDDFASVKHLS